MVAVTPITKHPESSPKWSTQTILGLTGLHMGVRWYEGYGVAICGASYLCCATESFLEPLRANPRKEEQFSSREDQGVVQSGRAAAEELAAEGAECSIRKVILGLAILKELASLPILITTSRPTVSWEPMALP